MAAVAKKLVLITGAPVFGFELTAQLMAKGSYHVLMGARSAQKGYAALQGLHSWNLPGSVDMLLLDVTKDDTIENAATKVRRDHGRLDILVNNAAVVPPDHTLHEQMGLTFNTNATRSLIMG